MTIYPPAPAQITGDIQSIHVLMQSPALLARRIGDLTMNRFLADVILPGRYPVSGGSIAWQVEQESPFTDRAVKAVTPGGEYPLASFGIGANELAEVVKWGQDTIVTDEAIKRLLMDPVNRALAKLANSVVKKVDSVALAVVTSQVTRTFPASAVWTGNGATILRDILRARAKVTDLDKGLDPTIAVVSDEIMAYVASDPLLLQLARREDGGSPVYSGQFPVVGGVTFLPASAARLPFTGEVLLLDPAQLGGMADEDLGGPGYAAAAEQPTVQVKVIRKDETDEYRPRARRVTVPVVVEPDAAIRITGVTA